MEKIVVTAGEKFTDIDVLACAISYSELLEKEGKVSVPIVSPIFNKSITTDIKSWKLRYKTEYENNEDFFVIVDTSHPMFFASFVKEERIIEMYDHHFGFEDYWKKKLGKNAKIEIVGSCATLIWEEFKKRHHANDISPSSANLLYTAIISNTLNFKASVTNKRDLAAFKGLQSRIKLPKNWLEKYFTDQEKAVFQNPRKEILNDTHVEKFPNSDGKIIVGQIELWNSKNFIEKYKFDIRKALESFGSQNWFLTSPSISEGKNYLFTKNREIKRLLEKIIDAKFDGDIGTTNKLWLRKEMLKKLSEIKK